MDKESLVRERNRQTYEQLKQRPRPKDDTPDLRAIFPPGHETLSQGLDHFHDLISEFVGASTFVENWIIVRTAEEQASGKGFNVLRHKSDHLAFLRARGGTDENFIIGALATSKQIDNGISLNVTATCSYSGGLNRTPGHDSLTLDAYIPPYDHNLTLQEYLTMIRSIVEWREPRMVSVGPGTYGRYDRVFWNRAWDGWIGWFPQEIDPRVLPDFALTWRIGNGTAVATQETNVLSRFPDQKEKANELEIALVEAGILPTEAELKGN